MLFVFTSYDAFAFYSGEIQFLLYITFREANPRQLYVTGSRD
jgi:hypothetical protein